MNTERQSAVAYRDGIAAIGAELDLMEVSVPPSQLRAFGQLKAAYERALAKADDLAAEEGVAPEPMSPIGDDQAKFYAHLAANLRWPPGYDAAHKQASVHQMLNAPTTENEARERAAEWYAANNTATERQAA